MSAFHTIIYGGHVVTTAGVVRADVGIYGGKITALGPDPQGDAGERIDATGLHLFAGVIDSHVHFNEPGRADWEGIETGSRAVAAGGGTMFFDMPLNAHPPTLDAESFALKLATAEKASVVDFAFWGGLTPRNLDKLEELASCGVIGFKAFMCNSGIDDFLCVDDTALRQGMKTAAALGLPVAVHAESEEITSRLSLEAAAGNRKGIRDYLNSRPIEAELDAIRRAIDLAGETKCSLHVVHVSSAAGVQLVVRAHAQGADATCETCPHYLVLTDEDMEKLGAVAKCSPPLRSSEEQERLWKELPNITTIGSDHSPCPPAMKETADFFKVWGGISGAQHVLPLLLSFGHHKRGVALEVLTNLLSDGVARRFRLPSSKGRIAVGCDADIALVDIGKEFEIMESGLFYRHRQSPYIGCKGRGVIRRTLVRGRTVFADGKIVDGFHGQLTRPASQKYRQTE